MNRAEVVIVGGGPAGATVGALLARAGREVVIVERAPAWRWRACGVFSSPAAVTALHRIGLSPDLVASTGRPIPAMRVEATEGTAFRLTYGGDGSAGGSPVGFDRRLLDEGLLDMARSAGAAVQTGTTVTGVALDGQRPEVSIRSEEGPRVLEADVVVGADGVRSIVARLAGVTRAARLARRVGLTFHVQDPRSPGDRPDARMVVFDDAYCGLAPVPGARLNVGIVLGERWRHTLARDGAAAVASRILATIPAVSDDPVAWAAAERLDPIEGAAPLGHRVVRRAGAGWLLVGDAAGFLDPLTGEGLHRALVSAELAAATIDAHLRDRGVPLHEYDRALGDRFRAKDAVTLIIQAFLARPALFRYAARRLARRHALRETMGLVIGDLVPATRALEPAFLAGLLWP